MGPYAYNYAPSSSSRYCTQWSYAKEAEFFFFTASYKLRFWDSRFNASGIFAPFCLSPKIFADFFLNRITGGILSKQDQRRG
jgi:hypothetical protein